jgi:alpha-1,6-mannosyltransferase
VVEVSSPWRSASMVADWRGTARRVLVAHADPLSAYAYRWFGGIADRAAIDRGFDWYWRHLRRLDAKYDLVVSASDSLSRRLIEGGLTKVMTNPMGIEPGHFSPARRDPALRARLLAECGLGEDALLLLGVGRHSPEKRWGMVARAVTAAAASRPMGLVIVGDGHDRRSVIRAVGGNPHIRLVAPIRDRPQLATLMASVDALVHGCEAETFCFVAAEAVASGLTVIAPDLGGAADCARANEGWTYKSASARSLSGALRQFAETQPRPRDPGRTRSMADHFGALFDAYAGLDPARTITR